MLKIFTLLVLFPCFAHAANWPQNMETYLGFRCTEKFGGHAGNSIRSLELSYTGRSAMDENGKPFRAFTLTYVPTYQERTEEPNPEIVQENLEISNLGNDNALLMEATSANAHQTGKFFRKIETRFEDVTILGVAGNSSLYRSFIVKSGNYLTGGEERKVREFSFYPTSCTETK